MAKTTKIKPAPRMTNHLWQVQVHHRDYLDTMNNWTRELRMTRTSLWITSPQKPGEKPNVEKAMQRTRKFLRSNGRKFALPTIEGVTHHGSINL